MTLDKDIRFKLLFKRLATVCQFLNENLETWETWIEDNRDLDPNVGDLADWIEELYEDREIGG